MLTHFIYGEHVFQRKNPFSFALCLLMLTFVAVKPIHTNMKRIVIGVWLTVILAICGTMRMQAQKIQVVDKEGQGIALASVMDGNGVLIGLTDLNGVLADVKGARSIAVTHVAYKPQSVKVADLTGGLITMEDNDFDIEELVVKPKPLIYTELYYRFYAYVDDSLRTFRAGIAPYVYNLQKKKTTVKYSDYAMAIFNLKDVTWWCVRSENMIKGGVVATPSEMELTDGRLNKKYDVEKVSNGDNRWLIVNPKDTIGTLVHASGISTFTIDGAKAQMYANERDGKTKLLKKRQELNYTYQYVEVFRINEDGEVGKDDYLMSLNHWEHDGKKGRETYIVEAWVTDRGYMDEDEFKQKRKDIDALSSTQNMWHMPLEELEAYERQQSIPPISDEVRKAISLITKDKWTK